MSRAWCHALYGVSLKVDTKVDIKVDEIDPERRINCAHIARSGASLNCFVFVVVRKARQLHTRPEAFPPTT